MLCTGYDHQVVRARSREIGVLVRVMKALAAEEQ